MSSSYVCHHCRQQLSRRLRTPGSAQWQSQATRLSSLSPKQHLSINASKSISQLQTQQLKSPKEHNEIPGFSNANDRSIPREFPTRYARFKNDYTNNVTPDLPTTEAAQPPNLSSSSDFGKQDYAVQLTELLAARKLNEAWEYFEKTYTSKDCEALTSPSARDLQLIEDEAIFRRLLLALNQNFCKGNTADDITPTTVLFRYEQLGIALPVNWTRHTIAFLTLNVIQAVNVPSARAQRNLPSLLFELLSVWRLFFQCKSDRGDALESIATDWFLPAVEDLPFNFGFRDFGRRLQEYHPRHVGTSQHGFCAIYLYTISDALNAMDSLQQQAAPFMQRLERILAGSRVDGALSNLANWTMYNQISEDVRAQIEKEIREAPMKAMVAVGTSEAITKHQTRPRYEGNDGARNVTPLQATDTSTESQPLTKQLSSEELFFKRIQRAIRLKESAGILTTQWEQVQAYYPSQGEIPRRLYNGFLNGFMALYQAPLAVNVWNHMIANKVQPMMDSWVAMLNGCALAKDSQGLNAMWTRLLSTGEEPDNYAWTSRIHGLFATRQTEAGLAALEEMGKNWTAAETIIKTPQTHGKKQKGPAKLPKGAKVINKCTKPSVEVVNAAITSLVKMSGSPMAQQNRVNTIGKILKWAGGYGIKADSYTYNAVIQMYIQSGDSIQAFKWIRGMEKAGVAGDSATYNMLVSLAFENKKFDGLSAEEQTRRIMEMFNKFEAIGLPLNDHIAATTVDKVLKQYSNEQAAGAIFELMAARGLSPNASMYSSLITHYFQQDPPALTTIETLVERIFNEQRMAADVVLFDRVLEGYAQHGDIGRMMSVLTRMARQQRRPGWRALAAVVRALVDSGDAQKARDIVRDVESGQGVARGSIASHEADERSFLRLAGRLGLRLADDNSGSSAEDTLSVSDGSLQVDKLQDLKANEEAQETDPLPG